jgi:hypothetical protein|tara:strand:- start:548 stop:835 length:288 start_codon:yes stop_codon:yes gene_type:complete
MIENDPRYDGHWNFRLFAEKNIDGGPVFSVHETFYDDSQDIPIDYNKAPVVMVSDDMEELIFIIEKMIGSFQQPILCKKNFPKEYPNANIQQLVE